MGNGFFARFGRKVPFICLAQEEKECGEDDGQEGTRGNDERGNGKVRRQVIKSCGQYGVDGRRAEGTDEQGALHDGIIDKKVNKDAKDDWRDDKAQDGQRADFARIAANLLKIDEESDWQHGNPRADMHKALEDRSQNGRTRNAKGI